VQLALGLDPAPLRLSVLGSGSRGNCLVIESNSRRLMIDAGFSCKQIEHRLRLVGAEPAAFDGLVLTHEHSDHCKGASLFARRHGLKIYATAGTFEETGLQEIGVETEVIRSGEPLQVGAFNVEPFAIPHDAREPVGLVVEDDGGRRVGLVADLGTRSRLAWGRLTDLDILVIEANHDLEMLRSGPYPWSLKQRVAGRHGHLSNREAAEGIEELLCDRLRWVVLYHLSQTNNLPALAAETADEPLRRHGSKADLCVTSQIQPTDWMEVGKTV